MFKINIPLNDDNSDFIVIYNKNNSTKTIVNDIPECWDDNELIDILKITSNLEHKLELLNKIFNNIVNKKKRKQRYQNNNNNNSNNDNSYNNSKNSKNFNNKVKSNKKY